MSSSSSRSFLDDLLGSRTLPPPSSLDNIFRDVDYSAELAKREAYALRDTPRDAAWFNQCTEILGSESRDLLTPDQEYSVDDDNITVDYDEVHEEIAGDHLTTNESSARFTPQDSSDTTAHHDSLKAETAPEFTAEVPAESSSVAVLDNEAAGISRSLATASISTSTAAKAVTEYDAGDSREAESKNDGDQDFPPKFLSTCDEFGRPRFVLKKQSLSDGRVLISMEPVQRRPRVERVNLSSTPETHSMAFLTEDHELVVHEEEN